MQYKDGNAPKKKENKSLIAIALSIFANSAIRVIAPPARKKDISNKNIKPTPEFLVFLPRLVVNSIFSLSKVRGLPTFTKITAEANITRAKITPSGCGTIYPSARLIKNSRKNKTLNKLSLFNLALMKLRIVASFCVLHKYNSCLNYNIKKQLIIVFYYLVLYSITTCNLLTTHTRLL